VLVEYPAGLHKGEADWKTPRVSMEPAMRIYGAFFGCEWAYAARGEQEEAVGRTGYGKYSRAMPSGEHI